MWKVLLVEDELFVRESIKETIHWEELGFTVIGEAGDGEEALAMMQSNMPDLVITDIIMPKMDGLELLRRAKKLNAQCKFVMLSAMGDFEYVQQALEEGASSYILKLSMSVQTLRDALQKIATELSVLREKPLQVLSDIYDLGWKAVLQHVTEGLPYDGVNKDILPKDCGEMWLTICSAMSVPDHLTLQEFEHEMGWDTRIRRVMHSHRESGVTTFFIWSPTREDVSRTSSKLPFPHAISVSSRPDQMLDTWLLVLKMLDAIWYGRQADALNNVKWNVTQSEAIFPWVKIRTLIDRFEQHHIQQCIELIDHFWDGMASVTMPMIVVKKKTKEILEIYERIVNGHTALSIDMDMLATHEQLRQAVIKKTRECLTYHIENTIKLSGHPEVNKIIVYIQQNFDKDITVKWLAQYIAMDENYISSLFKQKVDISLIQYLHKVRVEKALYYLTETDLSISKIGERVGFNNDNYFIKIFKRWHKYTPSYYRKINREKKLNLKETI